MGGELDPPQRRQRTLEAVKRLLLREGQVQPLLLLFEDLHRIDSESQALLHGLIESLPTARVLLLVTDRPEYQHAWGSKTDYTQIRIDPLPSESAEELLTALLGQDETLEPLKRVLIERAEGKLDNARACADHAVMVARGRGERGYEAWALRLLGDVTTHRARPDVATAAAHYGAAMNLASELEMRPLLAHCYFGLGRLYRRTGKPEDYWLEKLDKSN